MYFFTWLKFIKYSPAGIHHGTLMINSNGCSVVRIAYAVMHCFFIAYRTKWVIAVTPIYRHTPYISMEHYGNGVKSLNILYNIENISIKTIKRYRYSYSTESKDCCKLSNKKWSKNTSFVSTDCFIFHSWFSCHAKQIKFIMVTSEFRSPADC